MITSDNIWADLCPDESEETFRAYAARLSVPKDFPGPVHMFFNVAGSLVYHSWYHYPFLSVAFFHTVLGVERTLRWMYDTQKDSFKDLFKKAVEEGIVHDGIFEETSPSYHDYTKRQLELSRIPEFDATFDASELPEQTCDLPPTYSAFLSELVPNLRNKYCHGNFQMSPDFLPLSLRLREVADALVEFKRSQGERNNNVF